jgi:hypothetical protein
MYLRLCWRTHGEIYRRFYTVLNIIWHLFLALFGPERGTSKFYLYCTVTCESWHREKKLQVMFCNIFEQFIWPNTSEVQFWLPCSHAPVWVWNSTKIVKQLQKFWYFWQPTYSSVLHTCKVSWRIHLCCSMRKKNIISALKRHLNPMLFLHAKNQNVISLPNFSCMQNTWMCLL